MRALIESMEGQLTATLHLDPQADLDAARTLSRLIQR